VNIEPSGAADGPVDLPASVTAELAGATRREWLVTNGIGGYAFGTVSGALTRRYHGLLVAATRPPATRTLFLAKLEERLIVRGERVDLSTNFWSDGTCAPRGFARLTRFRLERGLPVWRWELDEVTLEKRIAMPLGENAVVVEYRLMPHSAPCELRLEALATRRSHHELTPSDGIAASAAREGGVVRVRLGASDDLWLTCPGSDATPTDAKRGDAWWRNIQLPVEHDRGYDSCETLLHAATFAVKLAPGDRATFGASAGFPLARDPQLLLVAEQARRQALLESSGAARSSPLRKQATFAADQFVVRRPLANGRDGWSIIAGYPWFADWSRDTMLSIDGLLLKTRRIAAARGVLETYARHLSNGSLPNRFADRDATSDVGPEEFNSVDAPLLFIRAIGLVDEAQRESAVDRDAWLKSMWPAVRSIAESFLRGMRHGIRVDPSDALVTAGEPGVQLTWMDAKVDGRVITPRIGKPVEVNALWYDALRRVESFARRLGDDAQPWSRLADRVLVSFERYWNPLEDCLYDVLDGPDGHDGSVRPNQILAAGLEHVALPEEQVRAVVTKVARDLFIPLGLRTLSPSDRRYRGRCEGGVRERDEAYHQGTAWPWMLGFFARAWRRNAGDAATLTSIVDALAAHLADGGLGSVSEIVDGDAPHELRGCPAQAWSVAALLELLCADDSGAARGSLDQHRTDVHR